MEFTLTALTFGFGLEVLEGKFMSNTITRKELTAWSNYIIGKPCPKHPQRLIQEGRHGNWCGVKNELGTWCDGGWPTKEWLESHREEKI